MGYASFLGKIAWLCSSASLVHSLPRVDLEKRPSNGLALTPPMGWNTYNHYSCNPSQDIVFSNAQALVDLGLQAAGYHYVTVDCGWTLPNRTSDGKLPWNPSRFPGGPQALAAFLHDRGLGFGVYSDGGIEMCMSGVPAQAGSLNHEQTDADSFASWGADLLKYDNCYSDAATNYPETQYTPSTSPSSHYVAMGNAVAATGRKMVFQLCNWGVDFPSAWAPKIGNSWRITNDIIPAYRTIPRILNQAAPHTDFAGPGHWLDLDMLEVGNNVFTIPEEQTHFSLWAIIKSPLVIGAALKDSTTSINAGSLAILKNPSVISYNQDSLGVAASFRRRWTEGGYELWAGPLSGSRYVTAIINLFNTPQKLTLNLPDVGFQSAGTLKDIWNGVSYNNVLGSYTATVQAHGVLLVELGHTTSAGYYDSRYASVSGQQTTYRNIYGLTSSTSYNLQINFPSTSSSPITISVSSNNGATTSHTLPANSNTLTIMGDLSLLSSDTNIISITSSLAPASLWITPPASQFYPSSSFTTQGTANLATCVSSGGCAPVGKKIGFLSPSGSASLHLSAPSAGDKYVKIHFINNDIAFATSFGDGTNTRNLTLSVNGDVQRVEVPLSGRSSELFSVGKGWEDVGIFAATLSGWKQGNNILVVGNEGGGAGVQSYGADVVGVEVFCFGPFELAARGGQNEEKELNRKTREAKGGEVRRRKTSYLF